MLVPYIVFFALALLVSVLAIGVKCRLLIRKVHNADSV
jgi:hypothetical protein